MKILDGEEDKGGIVMESEGNLFTSKLYSKIKL